jgi:hypothetical protein
MLKVFVTIVADVLVTVVVVVCTNGTLLTTIPVLVGH